VVYRIPILYHAVPYYTSGQDRFQQTKRNETELVVARTDAMRCDAMRCAPSPSTVRARLLNRPGSIHSRNRSPDPSSWARHDVPFRPVPSRSRASQWCAPCAGRPRRAVRHPPASRGPATRTSGPHRKWMQRGTVRCFLQARTTVRTRSHGVLYRYVLSTREEARRGEARRGPPRSEWHGAVPPSACRASYRAVARTARRCPPCSVREEMAKRRARY